MFKFVKNLFSKKNVVDFSSKKLGRHPRPEHANLVPDLGDHLAAHLLKDVNVPVSIDWSKKLIPSNIPMDANDTLGDCTSAAVAHMIAVWTVNVNWAKPTVLTQAEVIKIYEETTGYNPANPATDQGGVEVDVLNYWLNTGVTVPHALRDRNTPPTIDKLAAFAKFDPQNRNMTSVAIAMFGGAYIGLALPISAQTQTVWEITDPSLKGNAAPGSWGGHAVPIVGYDANYITFLTWGTIMKMSWDFYLAYTEEAYALLSEDWINSKGISPDDFNFAQLKANMNSDFQ